MERLKSADKEYFYHGNSAIVKKYILSAFIHGMDIGEFYNSTLEVCKRGDEASFRMLADESKLGRLVLTSVPKPNRITPGPYTLSTKSMVDISISQASRSLYLSAQHSWKFTIYDDVVYALPEAKVSEYPIAIKELESVTTSHPSFSSSITAGVLNRRPTMISSISWSDIPNSEHTPSIQQIVDGMVDVHKKMSGAYHRYLQKETTSIRETQKRDAFKHRALESEPAKLFEDRSFLF